MDHDTDYGEVHPMFENPANFNDYKSLALSMGYGASTISGWRKNGMPATVMRLMDRIRDLELEIEHLSIKTMEREYGKLN